jgi:alpha-glucosidase (family GH31 glycosyl hydrolase)
LYNDKQSPDEYSISYAKMSARLGKMIEVRTGCQTQDLPIFVRMLDKDSRWGFDNGLKSVVTTALVMSILGYPFILPDMIGGNAYGVLGNDTDTFNADLSVTVYPDYELYVRWAQLTAFMPSMQFSIPPWHYTNTSVDVNGICKKMVDLHESLVYPVLKEFAVKATQTAEAIIRPMWWVDALDENNLLIDDQFLVGDKILVAPVLDKGAVKRDVYLPKGKWMDPNTSEVHTGPKRLKDYPAPIDKIPYFLAA